MKERYTEEQIVGFLRVVDAGLPVKESFGHLACRHAFWGACSEKIGIPLPSAPQFRPEGMREPPEAASSS